MLIFLRSLTVHLVMFVMTVLAVAIPATATAGTTTSVSIAPAPTGAALGTWAAHAASNANWINYAGTTTSVPRDNWRNLGVAGWVRDAAKPTFDMNMIAGERWITMARADAGGLGLTSQQISDRMARFPGNSAYVFGAYSPENGELRIEVHRIEKRPDGNIYIDQADFTPWHGEKWKAAGKYRTAAEVSYNLSGYNPFENFKGSSVTDSLFHNIGWSAAQVAIGHAMRHYNAMLGFVAVSESRVQADPPKTSGGLFKKKTTQVVRGFVKPDWYVATPVEAPARGRPWL